MKGRFSVRIRCLLMISLFAPCLASACSIDVLQHVVRQKFVVVVKDRGKQISRMDVKLLRWDDVNWRYEVVKSVQSDLDGRALFSGAPLGEYRVRVSHGFVAGGDADLKVVRRGKAEDKIELPWPAAEVHQVRAVAGAFTLALTKEPLSGADVSVTEVGTNRIGSRTVADQRGRFRFDAVQPGLYILGISERTEEEGYVGIALDMVFESFGIQQQRRRPQHAHIYGNILVEVNEKARDRELPLGALSMRDCGMSYEPEATVAETD